MLAFGDEARPAQPLGYAETPPKADSFYRFIGRSFFGLEVAAVSQDASREMYSHLFDGARTCEVQLRALDERYSQAMALCRENDWPEQEGLLIIFANGLHYLRGEKYLQGLDDSPDHLATEVKRLTDELMNVQSMYSVMKFRAYLLNQDNQALEFQNTALKTENRWSGARLRQFREDEELLRVELAKVKQESEQLRKQLAVLEGTAEPAPPEPGFAQKLLRRLGRR